MPFIEHRCIASPETVRENIKSAVSRNLPPVRRYEGHDRVMSIAGGGPSLCDTYGLMTGYVAAANKAHDWLLERDIVPHFCGLLDPMPVLADAFTPDKRVTYLVASMCHPSVFDKLDGYKVRIWHASQGDHIGISDIVPDDQWQVPGGTTVSLRLMELGILLGFRTFHLHGLDSSFGKERHHAYDYLNYDDQTQNVVIQGYETVPALYCQVTDLFRRLERFETDDYEPMTFTVYGDGLLQHSWRQQIGSNVHRTHNGDNVNGHP